MRWNTISSGLMPPKSDSQNRLNFPNFLTCSRLLLSVIFIYFLLFPGLAAKIMALLTFGLAALTDYWDGRLARKEGIITAFGRLMDPIADKILTLSAFVSFVFLELIPFWMVLIVMARDFWITALRLRMKKGGSAQGAQSEGKQKTVLQMAMIIATLGYLVARETPVWSEVWTAPAHTAIFVSMLGVVGMTVWSAARYAKKTGI